MASKHKPALFDFYDDLVADDFLNPAMAVMQEAFDPQFGEAWNYMQTLSMLAMPLSHNQIALSQDGEPAAFTLSRAVADEEELLLIAVHPDFRGYGIGQILISRLLRQSRSRGCTKLFLEVRHNNNAREFYEKMQFKQIGKRPSYYKGKDGETFDAITYSYKL